jgi:transposase
MKKILYVGMDVHKESIAIACGAEGEEIRYYGTIPNYLASLDIVVRKLVSTGHIPYFVYEAGPGGYTIYRHLRDNGLDCMVAAPSLIPRKAGDRVKTDKRDAAMLARLLRAGELTKVHVPDVADEQVRDMFRARSDAKQMEKTARQNLLSFLLRIGAQYSGSRPWTKMYFRWLDALSLLPTQQLVLQEYVDTIRQCRERVIRYDSMLQDVVGQWKREPEVRKLQSLRGISFITAVGIIAELGDLRRFKSPRQLMAYAGLVPSENSSGGTIRRGGITKTGNRNVRWLLVESAWSYRLKARKSACLLRRQAGISDEVAELSWKAQVRLCGRYQRLLQKGKAKCKVIISIARELAGFIWALGNLTVQEEARAKRAAC